MKIAMISSLGIRCGISEYAMRLGAAMAEVDKELDLTFLANHPSGKGGQDVDVGIGTDIPPLSNVRIRRCFSVEGWSGVKQFDKIEFSDIVKGVDILHIQWEPFLLGPYIHDIFAIAKSHGKKIAITYHSPYASGHEGETDLAVFTSTNAMTTFPVKSFNAKTKIVCIPLPTPDRQATACSFGLGRSASAQVQVACNELGVKFTERSWQNWIPENELINWIAKHDLVILYYPPIEGAYPASSAFGVAQAAYRPILVSETNWFSGVPTAHGRIYKAQFNDKEDLKFGIDYLLGLGAIESERRSNCAKRLLASYQELR